MALMFMVLVVFVHALVGLVKDGVRPLLDFVVFLNIIRILVLASRSEGWGLFNFVDAEVVYEGFGPFSYFLVLLVEELERRWEGWFISSESMNLVAE